MIDRLIMSLLMDFCPVLVQKHQHQMAAVISNWKSVIRLL